MICLTNYTHSFLIKNMIFYRRESGRSLVRPKSQASCEPVSRIYLKFFNNILKSLTFFIYPVVSKMILMR